MIRYISFVGALTCALFLARDSSATMISLSLNLEFNDPTDMTSGGTWTAVAKADERGIAGTVMMFLNSSLNFNPATGFLTPAGFEEESSATFGLRLELVQGDGLGSPTYDVGVIGGPVPSTYVDDPNLTLLGANLDLGSFTGGVALATGSFDAGDIPAWFDDGNDETAGNVFMDDIPNGTTPAVAATIETTVRFVAVPEPTAIALLGTGLFGLLATHKRR